MNKKKPKKDDLFGELFTQKDEDFLKHPLGKKEVK
jgi:hypothetical protein